MIRANHFSVNPFASVMYVDMNSFFASCEQQHTPELRGKPVGVCPFPSPTACVIAPSIEAKKYGVKTGMRLNECKLLCPEIIAVSVRPHLYRQIHVAIMNVLKSYCDDVIARSIDEAVLNFSSYRWVYKDLPALALQIKQDIYKACGEYIRCSIGIAPNSFLAKLGTELQKPDGLVVIDAQNIDTQLAKLSLTDLPGIASRNERRLKVSGIRTPLEMRQASAALLRKTFGGVVGNYWHARLHFMEVDLYQNAYRAMSAGRTVSRQQGESKQALESLLISLCTRLEQRMVKQGVFCLEASFQIRYKNQTGWETKIQFGHALQDAMELRNYILERIFLFEKQHSIPTIFHINTQSMGVVIQKFIPERHVQYSLFENRIKQDKLRKVMYGIKDKYGRDMVRKASEIIAPNEMRDAIGFGSVKDFSGEGGHFNQFLLEE